MDEKITKAIQIGGISLLSFVAFLMMDALFFHKSNPFGVQLALTVYLIGSLTIKYFITKTRSPYPSDEEPFWIEYTAGISGLLALVWMFNFCFQIIMVPTGSLIPTVHIGDRLVANKIAYDFKLPLSKSVLFKVSEPKRGDIVLFIYPKDERILYVKRLIGLPDDVVVYDFKKQELSINSAVQPIFKTKEDDANISNEITAGVTHKIRINSMEASTLNRYIASKTPPEGCKLVESSLMCRVPKDHYFMMGDNRTDSVDSRVWGFVPRANVVGRVEHQLFNFSELSRVFINVK